MRTSKVAVLTMLLVAAGLFGFGLSQFGNVGLQGGEHEHHRDRSRGAPELRSLESGGAGVAAAQERDDDDD